MPRTRKLPSADYFRQFVKYDPLTGEFIWIAASARKGKTGCKTGFKDGKDGYILVRIEDVSYRAHRLAWLLEKGEDPGHFEVDHINGDKADNRIENLRLSTRGQNRANSVHNKSSKSGLKGVYWCKKQKKWRAQITINKKVMKLGAFANPFEAHMAYREAAVKCHGEFANFG
jgi:hypothetical protein